MWVESTAKDQRNFQEVEQDLFPEIDLYVA